MLRSISPVKNRFIEDMKLTTEKSQKIDSPVIQNERSRQIDTIIQLTGTSELLEKNSIPRSNLAISERLKDESSTEYIYNHQNTESKNEYQYSVYNNNLTYPCVNNISPNSPKRISLDDRYLISISFN